jgi:hypothetical protein
MTFTIPTKLKLTALMAVLAALLIVAVPASAIVPPKNCGTMSVSGKRWQVIADQITCSSAKRYATTYIRSYDAPRYYKCQRGPSGSSLWRTCRATRYNPDREFKIIKK